MKFWKKFRKRGFWIGAVLFTILYVAGIFVREFCAPMEYEFALQLRSLFPALSGTVVPKIPALFSSLLSGLLLYILSLMLKLHRPWTATGIFLLSPLYFYVGTGAGSVPFFIFCMLLFATAFAAMFRCRSVWAKALWGLAGIGGAALFCFAVEYGFFISLFWYCFWLPCVAVGGAALIERLHDRDRAVPLVNAFARISGILLVLTAVMLLIPAIARYFHLSYPHYLIFYARSERLYRPILTLLIPLLWLHLCRTERKLAAKESFFGAALAFLLLLTPVVLPLEIRRDISPAHLFRRYRTELTVGDPSCWSDDATAAALVYETGLPVSRFGYDRETTPVKLKNVIEKEHMAGRNVVVAFSSHNFDSSLPTLPGVRYTSGKYVIIRYPGGVLK